MKALEKVRKFDKRLEDNIQCDLIDAPTLINTLIKKGFAITKVAKNGVINDSHRVIVFYR